MTSFNDPRRGYDDRYYDHYYDRYDNPDYLRQGQLFEPRWQGYERSARLRGDWMREAPWMREWYWTRGQVDNASMVKVIEIVAQSPHSWEDATRRAIAEASRTVRGIRSIYVQDMQAVVDDDQIVTFRINAKVSFVLDDHRRRR